MSFGVKYTGPDGRQRSFRMDSVPKEGSELADIASGRGRFPDFRRTADQNRRPAEAKPEVDVMPGGGVVKGRNGMLCLMGEESSPLVEGVKLFASVNGRKGYHTLDEIDTPTGGGARVGPADECDQEDPVAEDRPKSDGVGWATSVTGRMLAKRESGHTVIYQYTKDLLVSPGQRLVGVTAEHRRVVGLIPGGDGDDWPFRTKWVGSEDDGGWAMYLPRGCVTLDGVGVDVTGGLTQAEYGDEDLTDWYMLGVDSGEVWVVASRVDEGGGKSDRYVTARIVFEEQDAESDMEGRFLICSISEGGDGGHGTVTHIQASCLRIFNLDDCQPWPFMVRWFGDKEDGAYGMYLPLGCVNAYGQDVDVTDGLTPIGGAEDWYETPSRSGPISVRVDESEDGESVTGEIFAGEPSSHEEEDENVFESKICDISDDCITQIQASRLFVSRENMWDGLSVSAVEDENGEQVVPTTLGLLDFQKDGFWSESYSFHTLLFEVGKDSDYNENVEKLRDSHVLIRRKQTVGEEEKFVLEYLPIGRLHRPLMELDEQKNKSLGMRWDSDKEAWILWCGDEGGNDEGGNDEGGGPSEVSFIGTDGVEGNKSDKFTFANFQSSDEESNVVVKCDQEGNITIGAYYV